MLVDGEWQAVEEEAEPELVAIEVHRNGTRGTVETTAGKVAPTKLPTRSARSHRGPNGTALQMVIDDVTNGICSFALS